MQHKRIDSKNTYLYLYIISHILGCLIISNCVLLIITQCQVLPLAEVFTIAGVQSLSDYLSQIVFIAKLRVAQAGVTLAFFDCQTPLRTCRPNSISNGRSKSCLCFTSVLTRRKKCRTAECGEECVQAEDSSLFLR